MSGPTARGGRLRALEEDSLVIRAFSSADLHMFELRVTNPAENPIVEMVIHPVHGVEFEDDEPIFAFPPDPGIPGQLGPAGEYRFYFEDAWRHIRERWGNVRFRTAPHDEWQGAARPVGWLRITSRADRLTFPVEVRFADGTVEKWFGPPASAWPAPTLRLVTSSPRLSRSVPALLILGCAIMVLRHQLRRRRGEGPESR